MVTKETKYFVPDIEDIRVGYECEMKMAEQEDIWVKTVFAIPDITSICNREGDKFSLPIDIIRVPFLTKEQIEAEGWEVTEGIFEGGDRIVNTIHGFKNNFMFSYINGRLRILFKDPSIEEAKTGVLASTIYYGECKDINTFRYICKLLKINE